MQNQQIEKFMRSKERAKWIYSPKMSVFVRKSIRVQQEDRCLRCFDIATVNVVPTHQKQGHFAEFLKNCEELAKKNGFDGIFVESVLNEHLWGFLQRNGYDIFQKGECFVPNYYKELNPYAKQSVSDIYRANNSSLWRSRQGGFDGV